MDEESGGYGGVAYLAEKGFFSKPRVDHVIIPEPLNKDRICLGHRGVWWAEIETKGRIAHGSMPFLGDSAIRHMSAVLSAFETELYPALDRKQTTMPVVPEGARRSTMNFNSIHGGQTEDFFPALPSPTVADSCRLVIDRRFLLEENIDEVKGEVTTILERLKRQRDRFDYSIRDLMEVLPTMTERDAPVVKAVAEGIREIFGREPDYVISPGTYDQKHMARIGHLHDAIAYGPGILDLAHQPDEWVGIADMVESAKVMAIGLDLLLRGSGRDTRVIYSGSDSRFDPPRSNECREREHENLEIPACGHGGRAGTGHDGACRTHRPRARHGAGAAASGPDRGRRAGHRRSGLRQRLPRADAHRRKRPGAAGPRQELGHVRRRKGLHLPPAIRRQMA